MTGRGDCAYLTVVLESLRRIQRDLAEALDRTPATVSSRTLIEGALRLAEGGLNAAMALAASTGCRGARLHGELEDLDVA